MVMLYNAVGTGVNIIGLGVLSILGKNELEEFRSLKAFLICG